MRGRYKNNARVRKHTGVKLTLHPLFFLVGIVYAFTGDLPLFLLSCLVALQHECAHAFAAAKRGYTLNRIVLMPFGAVIDGDMRGLSVKDEIAVALAGPLCNLVTAAFFVALWWCFPVAYAYTDVACYASLSVALVNLLPAYPLDGGRILRCTLIRAFAVTQPQARAEKLAAIVCRGIALFFAAAFFAVFAASCFEQSPNFSMLAFGAFLLVGSFGNGKQAASYDRLQFSSRQAFERGIVVKRVAIAASRPVKDVFRHLESGVYLVFEVYDEEERYLFELTQNELSVRFAAAPSPYTPIGSLCPDKTHEKRG